MRINILTMTKITITIEAKLATDLREFIDPMLLLKRIGMSYFQKLTDGSLVLRTVTEQTERKEILDLIASRRVYIPVHPITSEKT